MDRWGETGMGGPYKEVSEEGHEGWNTVINSLQQRHLRLSYGNNTLENS